MYGVLESKITYLGLQSCALYGVNSLALWGLRTILEDYLALITKCAALRL
jgi:hypothetical protein